MTNIAEARQINEAHHKLNNQLREELKVLADVAFEMYDLLSQIDFAHMDGELKMVFTENVKYDDVPWERWETVLEQRFPTPPTKNKEQG